MLLHIIFPLIIFGQNNLPPVYEINADTASAIRLDDAYWQMLEDPEGEWTIDEVSRPPIAVKFHANTTKIKGVDYSINTFWLRYHFKNSMGHEARITIPKDVSSAVLYSRGPDGKWNHKTTGKTVPWSKRDDLKRITTVTYRIQPGEELLIYERDIFNYPINQPDFLEINFGFTDKVIQDYYNDNDSSVLPSFLFGFFLIAALFNIYFFLVVRERVYLFFSLMLLGRGLPLLLDNIVFLPEHPVLKWYAEIPFWMSYFFFLIHFVRYFLETFKYVPRWDKFLIGLSIYTIIINILGAMNIIGGEPYHAAVTFFIFITFTLFIRSTDKSIRWRVAMVLPAFCILLTSLFDPLFSSLKKYTGIQVPALFAWLSNRFTNLEELSLVWLSLFFSWSLFQRYQQLQKTIAQEALGKERLENELKFQQLEGEKTKAELERQAIELQIKAIVTTQEEERKRISGDLHDDVGTKLSAVNLFLSSLSERATRTNDEEIKLLAQSSKQILKETMTDLRQILRNLNPLVLEEYGYIVAVTGLANKINETKQVHFNLEVPDTPLQLDKENELMLYRITQELMNNVLKHAGAKHVWLSIEKCERKIVLKLEDDGNGFDVNVPRDGYGLHNLDARTKLMQGNFVINSQPGKGTVVIIEIPYDLNKSL